MKNTVVLWTGGKDSCLALHMALEQNLNVIALVTFVPHGNAEFRAHPQPEMREQARRIGLPIQFIEIAEPYRPSYIDALRRLKASLDLAAVITGDIDLVDGQPNWIAECCFCLGIEVLRPLWQKPRPWVMGELLNRNIRCRVTHLNHPSLPPAWLHRVIDEAFLKEMEIVSKATGADLAGENGEYHTMVMDAPAFSRPPR